MYMYVKLPPRNLNSTLTPPQHPTSTYTCGVIITQECVVVSPNIHDFPRLSSFFFFFFNSATIVKSRIEKGGTKNTQKVSYSVSRLHTPNPKIPCLSFCKLMMLIQLWLCLRRLQETPIQLQKFVVVVDQLPAKTVLLILDLKPMRANWSISCWNIGKNEVCMAAVTEKLRAGEWMAFTTFPTWVSKAPFPLKLATSPS